MAPPVTSVRAYSNPETVAARAATRATAARSATATAVGVRASNFNAHSATPLSLHALDTPGPGPGSDAGALSLSRDDLAGLGQDLQEVRAEFAANAIDVADQRRADSAETPRLTVLEEWMTRAANRSAAGAEASLVERQAHCAQAGLATLSELLQETLPGADTGHLAINRDITGRARQLLQAAAAVNPAAYRNTDGAGDSGWLAAELAHPTEFTGALAARDLKAGAKLQHSAMAAYLGDKSASAAQKSAAREFFLRQVDSYLDNPEAQPPQLTGADHSPAGVLKPEQKAALLVARSLERASDLSIVAAADKPLFKEMANPAKVGKRLEQHLKQALRADFKPIQQTFNHAGQDYHSELTPDVSAQPGRNTGVLCSDTHSYTRVPNMWRSQFQDSAGKTLFEGTRCGVLCAFGMRPPHLRSLPRQELHDLIRTTLPQQAERLGVERCAKYMTSRFSIKGFRLRKAARLQANRNRAQDLVRFHLQHNAKLMDAAARSTAQPPRVKMVLPSINLVTPDYMRSIASTTFNILENYNELRMTRNQDKALQALAEEPLPVTVTGPDGMEKTVLVEVAPLTFSAGVNDLALGKSSKYLGSWGKADEISGRSMKLLLGENFKSGEAPASGLVAEHLQALADAGRGDSQEARLIRQLADQIGNIWEAKSHHTENNDPYALPARLALLTSRMGLDPQYNCKSGKDRTGQLDAEIKFLATRIELAGGAVPQPGGALNDEEKGLFSKVLLHSGNHEIQKMNTGSPGYKVKLASITRRMDSMMTRLQHLGSGKFVGA